MPLDQIIAVVTDIPALVWIAAALAGLVRGFSGFGAAMIFMPLASTVIEPAAAVVTLLIADGALGYLMVPAALKLWTRREVLPLSAGATVMIPVGAALLAVVDPQALRWVVSILALAAVALLASGWRYDRQPGPALSAGVGATSGFLGGLAGYAGPPVVLFWLGGRTGHTTVRANIIVYFGWTTTISVASYALYGLLGVEEAVRAVALMPVYALAMRAGALGFGRASPALFRRTAYAIIAVSALRGLPLLDGLF